MVGDGSQLRTEEVAELLNLSKSTVINYANDGLLVVKRTRGRHRRFPIESVQALQQVLEMDEGPEQTAEFERLRRAVRGETE
ncbi:MAG TPA: helix-turn-helix domain-containing protein [Micromonosporaceae bacterium]|nr:helix-turn-helix domain-containing protein [Micromonosporaceae bacterium]